MMSALASIFICLVVVWNYKSKQHRQKLERIEKEKQTQLLKVSIEGQENERKRIANDLHDGIGPLLSALKLQINTQNDFLNKEDINKNLDETIQEIRAVSSRMSPAVLDELGLNEAIKNIIYRFKKISSVEIYLEWDDNIQQKIGINYSIHVYRIIQEALNNVLKHSKANKVELKGKVVGSNVSISISDNGIGFNVGEEYIRDSIGLDSMQARCKLLQAIWKIESNDHGTTITIILKNKK